VTLPQDVATLLATAGVAETAYQEFTNDTFADAAANSHWRLLRQVASSSGASAMLDESEGNAVEAEREAPQPEAPLVRVVQRVFA